MTSIADIIVPPPEYGEVFSPVQVFKREAPFELEIGSGKGAFLLARAREHPGINLLGIEYASKYFQYTADRMARWGLANVRLMRVDARYFVMHHLPRGSLAALHVYHPDPWPKHRHYKRRLFQPDFVAAAVTSLQDGGRWAIQTDHAEYFRWILDMLGGVHGLEPTDFDDREYGIVEASAGTNFEIKYRREGREIYQVAYRRVDSAFACPAGDGR